jgi:hypothetical protein
MDSYEITQQNIYQYNSYQMILIILGIIFTIIYFIMIFKKIN